MTSLVLASQSPRRKELLAQLGYQFTCLPANIDEKVHKDESAYHYVERLAKEKALHVAATIDQQTVVLGSDTSVVVDEIILGKPCDYQDCLNMLMRLSGRKHQVLTAIAAVKGDEIRSDVISTDVEFCILSEQIIERYWQTGEPQDKAGGYGIQGLAAQFVVTINGSYSSVVGLPLFETANMLSSLGCKSIFK